MSSSGNSNDMNSKRHIGSVNVQIASAGLLGGGGGEEGLGLWFRDHKARVSREDRTRTGYKTQAWIERG